MAAQGQGAFARGPEMNAKLRGSVCTKATAETWIVVAIGRAQVPAVIVFNPLTNRFLAMKINLKIRVRRLARRKDFRRKLSKSPHSLKVRQIPSITMLTSARADSIADTTAATLVPRVRARLSSECRARGGQQIVPAVHLHAVAAVRKL